MSPSPVESRIAVDGTLWDEPTTGIGLYTHQLVGAMRASGRTVQVLGAAESGEAPRGRASRTLWTVGMLPEQLRQRQIALYHAHGNFNLPLLRQSGTGLVLTVHDLIPVLLPSSVSTAFHLQFRLWLQRSVALADRIVCVSERTRQDLLERLSVPEPKTVVIPNGVDHVARYPADPTTRTYLETLGLPDSFILFAGAWDRRKNLSLVLDAWELLPPNARPPLVLAGQSWFGSSPIEKRVARLRADRQPVQTLGFVSPQVLYELMRRATVFVFPSWYEGFGLPPLEAMWQGTPTIISDRGSLPEVCGDAAVQVPPDDAPALAAALERLLGSSALRDSLRAKGAARAREFTWARSAQATLEVYDDVLGQRSELHGRALH